MKIMPESEISCHTTLKSVNLAAALTLFGCTEDDSCKNPWGEGGGGGGGGGGGVVNLAGCCNYKGNELAQYSVK